MDAQTDSELDPLACCRPRIEVSHGLEDTQPSPYRSLGIVFMGLGIAKVDQESIPEKLRNVPVIALDHLGAGGLIGPDHVPVVFRVELAGERGGVHQVTEQHGELPAFGVRRARGDWGGLGLRRSDVRRGRQRR